MSIQTPNMFLYQPTIGIDSGLVWEQNVNANSSIIDGHNHSIGSGIQIGPSGLNINADLPFNINNATSLRSVRFSSQLLPISGPLDIGCIYFSGVDFYANDVNGNQIQITKGGTVNATSSGISSGTATASFVSSTLVVNAASNTPANIQGASLLMGNTGVSGSFYLTLSPPSALVGNYSLTLPSIPSQTNSMTLDTSGNMSSITFDQVGVNMTSVGANAIANSRSRATPVVSLGPAGAVVSSNSCGFYTNTSVGIPIQIPNLSVSLVTTGRPICLTIQAANGTSGSFVGVNANNFVLDIVNGTTSASFSTLYGAPGIAEFPPGLTIIDTSPVAGIYTWTVFGYVNGGTGTLFECILIAYEL